MLYFRWPGRPSQQHNFHIPKACLLLRLIKQGEAKIKGRAAPQILPELPSTASSFPSPACADNERTFPQLVLTLWLSVGYPGKILWINPSTKPKFTPRTVSFTLRCKELKQWFISMRIEKCLPGKESSGAKGSLQPHSLALPMICLQGPSVRASSDGFVQLGPLILRDSHTNSNAQAKQGSQPSQMGIRKAGCVLVGGNL